MRYTLRFHSQESPASIPYTLHYTPEKLPKNAIFICISAKKVVPLQRKLSKIKIKIE